MFLVVMRTCKFGQMCLGMLAVVHLHGLQGLMLSARVPIGVGRCVSAVVSEYTQPHLHRDVGFCSSIENSMCCGRRGQRDGRLLEMGWNVRGSDTRED